MPTPRRQPKEKPPLRVVDTVGIAVPDDVEHQKERKLARMKKLDDVIMKMRPTVDKCHDAKKIDDDTARKWNGFANDWDLTKEQIPEQAFAGAWEKMDEVQAELAHWQGLFVQLKCGPFGVPRIPAKEAAEPSINPLQWVKDKLSNLQGPGLLLVGLGLWYALKKR